MHLLCHQEIEPFSLTIKQGEIFGLVGPIGSGKSTIIDLLSGRKTPLGGAVSIMGYDVRRVEHLARQLVGVVPLNAVIFRPHEGERLKAGPICIQGYAVAGEGQHIERVELSSDGGATWTHATWLEPPQPWTWGFWEVTVPLGPGTHQLIVRAWDSAGGTQPEDLR